MPFLRDTYQRIRNALWLAPTERKEEDDASAQTEYYLDTTEEKTYTAGLDANYKMDLDSPDRPKKRKMMDNDDDTDFACKKTRIQEDEQPELCRALTVSRINDGIGPLQSSKSHQALDRHLMPPPAAPSPHKSPNHHSRHTKRESLESVESFSDTQTQKSRLTESEADYEVEAALQRAATIELPPNSGTWEPAERELFHHLAHRGFEPLLSKSWMIDFPTLPLSLFAELDDQTPLISVQRTSDFRAIRALRELIDTGKSVRDCVLSTTADLRTEPIIERATKKYIKWALKDLGISSKQCIPVHAVVSMQRGQTTQDTIRDLTLKMHKLSARHRSACDVLTSIEHESKDENTPDETRLSNDLDIEHNLPVIYGLMICSSLLAVFTLSSHTPPPRFVVRATSKLPRSPNHNEKDMDMDEDDANEDSGLRFIASFDFSDSTTDVWNAFVVAIAAMMVRKTLAEVYDIPPAITTGDVDVDESVLESSLLDADLEDGRNWYHARYGADLPLFLRHRLPVRVDETVDYDPDL